MFRAAFRPVIDLVLPPRCPGCGGIVEADHRFCAVCWSAQVFLDNGGCAHCAMPLRVSNGAVCAPCMVQRPAFDAVVAGVAYGDVASHVALRLKYARRPGLALMIAQLIAHRVPRGEDVVIVPVPLHRWRLWQRGFNQAAAIGVGVARLNRSAFMVDGIMRVRATASMRGLNPAQRKRSVAGAFRTQQRFDGMHVVLVDDVLTTGATAGACAAVLKRSGAARVTLVCWARVIADD